MTYYPYKDKAWFYEHYVRKRMKLQDMADLLKEKYNIKTTPQTLYNWAERHDLLKFRGKGRKLGANMQRRSGGTPTRKKPQVKGMTASKAQEEAMRRRNKARKIR